MASAIQLGCVILSSLSLRLTGAELLARSLHHEPGASFLPMMMFAVGTMCG
jgi:hypothetical protein